MSALTGERVSTAEGGFNPTWQRHVSAYELCGAQLPDGPVLDLGCGVGHSYQRLAPRETVGVDIDAGALAGQDREVHAADMRKLPFGPGRFASVLSVHSLEHVPDPDAVIREVARVLGSGPDRIAVFVTPNRLTFGMPDEIIDPFHYVEFDHEQLAELCRPFFEQVEIRGIAGSERYLRIVKAEKQRLHQILGWDPLRLRRVIPMGMRRRLYDRMLIRERGAVDPAASSIGVEDFSLVADGLTDVLDVVAICRSPIPA